MSILKPEETHADIKILTSIIETLPGEVQITLKGTVKQLNDRLNHKSKILGMVQSALGQLRLDMKYLMFDLEATRRERDALKERLGDGT